MMFSFGDAAIQLALDRQRHLDGHRRHELEQQSGNCGIDVNGGHALAGSAACGSLIDADIARPCMTAISDVHRAAAPATHNPALQQCRSLSRRTKRAWSTEALRVAPQLFLDGLEFSPRDIS